MNRSVGKTHGGCYWPFRFPAFRSGMPNRSVKDCRVGRKKLRPPRNDTKMVGFHRKPTIFVSEMFEIRHGAIPPQRPLGALYHAAAQ